jgi:hypothetical protein
VDLLDRQYPAVLLYLEVLLFLVDLLDRQYPAVLLYLEVLLFRLCLVVPYLLEDPSCPAIL